MRESSQIDQIAEAWVREQIELFPAVGTWIGDASHDDAWGDYSPAGFAAYRQAAARVRTALSAAVPSDEVDRVTQLDLLAELTLVEQLHEAGWDERDLNVIASPAQEFREIFDLMPQAQPDDWANIAARLNRLPEAMAGYQESLRAGARAGNPPAERQVREVAELVAAYAKPDGFFFELIEGAPVSLSPALNSELRRGAQRAAESYAGLSEFLRGELLSQASPADGVGRELYTLLSRKFLGASIDLDETYDWGLAELGRMVAEQEAIAERIAPGRGVRGAVEVLDQNPAYLLHGTEELQRWMQEISDRAVAELGAQQFDIPEQIRRLECRIAPTQEGGIYYTGPSDDFSRPGRMWWSVPPSVTTFHTWREKTTVYHEGVPGHHLQIGQAVLNRGQLNLWRRQLAGSSGHAEGWALYAERLMEQLGYLDDPADRFGMLDGQRMRAARVVLDIGLHLGKPRPDGKGTWDANYAFEFFAEHNLTDPASQRFEVLRYLGWPGQAPSYKVGQRIWENIRDAEAGRLGPAFSLRDFHSRALGLGGLGLDTLRSALAS